MDPIGIGLQLLASGMSLLGVWFIGNKSIRGPVFALAAQVPWIALTFYCQLWGFIPADVIFTALLIRNFIKWRRDAKVS